MFPITRILHRAGWTELKEIACAEWCLGQAKLGISFKKAVQALSIAKEYSAQWTAAKYKSNQCKDQSLGIGALQLATLDPRIQITGNHFNQFSKVRAQERIEILSQV